MTSSTGKGEYSCEIRPGLLRCSCPDFGWRKANAGRPCKHLRAVAIEALAEAFEGREGAQRDASTSR